MRVTFAAARARFCVARAFRRRCFKTLGGVLRRLPSRKDFCLSVVIDRPFGKPLPTFLICWTRVAICLQAGDLANFLLYATLFRRKFPRAYRKLSQANVCRSSFPID